MYKSISMPLKIYRFCELFGIISPILQLLLFMIKDINACFLVRYFVISVLLDSMFFVEQLTAR